MEIISVCLIPCARCLMQCAVYHSVEDVCNVVPVKHVETAGGAAAPAVMLRVHDIERLYNVVHSSKDDG